MDTEKEIKTSGQTPDWVEEHHQEETTEQAHKTVFEEFEKLDRQPTEEEIDIVDNMHRFDSQECELETFPFKDRNKLKNDKKLTMIDSKI